LLLCADIRELIMRDPVQVAPQELALPRIDPRAARQLVMRSAELLARQAGNAVIPGHRGDMLRTCRLAEARSVPLREIRTRILAEMSAAQVSAAETGGIQIRTTQVLRTAQVPHAKPRRIVEMLCALEAAPMALGEVLDLLTLSGIEFSGVESVIPAEVSGLPGSQVLIQIRPGSDVSSSMPLCK
jgi:hypothetical protein